jgi:hypothetical protein
MGESARRSRRGRVESQVHQGRKGTEPDAVHAAGLNVKVLEDVVYLWRVTR